MSRITQKCFATDLLPDFAEESLLNDSYPLDLAFGRKPLVKAVAAEGRPRLEDPLELLGPGSFDVVCSCLLLFHLVGRQEKAIARMAQCLRPGGWLIDEDADWGTPGSVDPSHPSYQVYHDAWRNGDWWISRAYDPVFGRKLPNG